MANIQRDRQTRGEESERKNTKKGKGREGKELTKRYSAPQFVGSNLQRQ